MEFLDVGHRHTGKVRRAGGDDVCGGPERIGKKRFDLVLFDSPPLNAATDSVVIGTQTEGVILIVRAQVTNRKIAKQKLDLFHNVPANLIGVILNGTQADLAHEGYSYYHY